MFLTVMALIFSPFLMHSAAAATTSETVDDSATSTTPAALRYVGDWKVTTGADKYMNTDHRTAKANAKVEITYTGSRIRLYGPTGLFMGKASISIDGGPSTVLDSYRPSLQEQSDLYMSDWQPHGQHKAVITVLGQRNPASQGNVWALDSVKVVSNAVTVPTALPAPVIKTNYGGLYGTTEADRTRRGVDQLWLKVRWSDLEPQQGVYNWTPITNKLAANPGLVVRVHVRGGPSAPQWLLASAGTVQISNNKDQLTATVGKYWTPQYMTAYKKFATAMGTAFDTNPRVASINMFGTSLIYDEPWITGGHTSGATLYTAGLTKDKVIAAQNAGLAATVAAFPHTMVEMPLHGQFTYPVSGGQAGKWSDGIALANSWDQLYGDRVIFTHYGWGAGDYTPAAATLTSAPSLYSWMHKRADLGRPIAFQATLAPGVPAGEANPTSADAIDAADGAVRMGARWFEHHSWSLLTVAQAQAFDAGLKANVKANVAAADSAVARQAGPNRYATSALISKGAFSPGVPVAYVATGANFPDALSGGAAAAHLGGPLLLTYPDRIASETAAELTRLKPGRIVVLGSHPTVTNAVQTALRPFTAGGVSRLSGPNRYATSALISKGAYSPGVPVAYVATGANFPDALSGGAAAAHLGGPLLLTYPDRIASETAAELTRLKPGRIVVLGSHPTVTNALAQSLRAYESQK